ncbi:MULTISPECIES: hypothetical protein [unclassified Treponema]|uniref:hypothetical protein n=1 Tax=unclassified Treponema TaxID=2638727 RepID=UPI0020A3638A|nr:MULTISPECIES: hypothetical protein [unclassified Treponema]UTC66125.1 hypothetical protein E4O06_08855 [Treponema sp. OMZ 789]UTC68854.1 hypothetical protein E4O01_08995 [Treponema sp. OMZ 790]UTC71582.1 hypothetical protein E4O02_09185 [Treponema sp. OMZ 791]
MKKILLKMIFVVILLSLYAEHGVGSEMPAFFDKVNPLIEKNPQYKRIELDSNLNRMLLFSEFANWFPSPYADLNTSVSGVKIDKLYKSFDTDVSFGISQKLPLGIKLNIIGKQSYGIFFDSQAEYSYKFDSGANLSVPLWFMAPSAVSDFIKQEFNLYREKKRLYSLEKDKGKKDLIVKILFAVGSEKILKKKIALLKNIQKWNIEENEKNKVLFSQGKLSVLEYSEMDKKMRQNDILLFQTEQSYDALISEISAMGLELTDLDENIDSWLEFFENFVFYLQNTASAGDETSLLRHQTSWLQSVQNFRSKIPNFFISCNVDFKPAKAYYPSFPAAFMGCWKDNPQIKWSVSMNLRINLSPFHDEFKLNKNFKILKEINDLDESFLKNKIEEGKRTGLKNIEEARFIKGMAKSALEIQKQYYTLAEEFHKQGRTSMHELSAAKNLLEETKINYYAERLSYILKILQVYNF